MKKKHIVYILAGLVNPFRWLILSQMMNVVFWASLSWALPFLIERVTESAEAGLLRKNLLYWIGWLLALYVCWGLSYRVHDLLWRAIQPRLRISVIEHMLDLILRGDRSTTKKESLGEISNKLQQVGDAVVEILEACVDSLFRAFCIIVVGFISFFQMDSGLAVLFAAWVFFFGWLMWWRLPKILYANSRLAHRRHSFMGETVDILRNLLSIHIFGTADQETKRLQRYGDQTVWQEKSRDLEEALLYFLQSLSFTCFAGVGFCMIYQLQHLSLLSVLPKYVVLLELISSELMPLSEDMQDVFDGWGYIQQAQRFLLPDRADALSVGGFFNPPSGEIIYQGVTFAYPASKPLFENLNVTIKSGSRVALVGYSGSGKTSFVKLLLGLHPIQRGAILIGGQPIEKAAPGELSQAISFITQDIQLFNRTVMENIRYAHPQATPDEVIEAAKKAYAHDFIEQLPAGYNTYVGQQGMRLSGGKRQRLTIARAFLKLHITRPKILIMDEATSQLDPLSESLVHKGRMALLEETQATCLLITHRLRLKNLSEMDDILVLTKGRICQKGPHKDLIKETNGAYAALWREQNK